LAIAPASTAATPKLIGTVGPGFTITLKKPSGVIVKTLKPGLYTFVVTDKSTIHDFTLVRPGLSKVITGIAFTGKKTLTLRLRVGKYIYECRPHKTTMKGSFVVKR